MRPTMARAERILELPEGNVTFLFTDIEGSTRLLERFGSRLTTAMAFHHELLTDAIAAHGGVVFETVGDAVYAAFTEARDGVLAAADAQRAMAAHDWGDLGEVRVRISVHRGEVERRGAHYLGPALFRAARILALAHGGQVLVSDTIAGAVTDELPGGLGLRAMGRHRLKDLVEPEEVWQVTGADLLDGFPPLRAVDARTDVLPRPVSSFVGREPELAEIGTALEAARLVTVVAAGGTGKTRVAVEAGHCLRERFRDGVAFVDLSPVRTAEAIAAAVAAVLGVRPVGDEPHEAALARWLAERELLLIADNLEQIPRAGAPLARLLESAAGLHVLATSRERLSVRGERVVTLEPLAAERVGHATDRPSDAERLFLDRAGQAAGDLTDDDRAAVQAIVRRLDGLPLAIEIAAARARSMPLPMLRRLLERRLPGLAGPDDLPDRQRTLQDTIAWSVGLLAVDSAALFTSLSAFPSSWPLSAVAPVVAPDLDLDDAVLVMSALVDKSLVRAAGSDPFGSPRYALLETTRQVAAGLVPPDTAATLRGRHAAWVVALAEQAEPELVGADVEPWTELLVQQRYDLEAAVDHALATGDVVTAQRITGATWRLGWLQASMLGPLAALGRRATERPEPTPPLVRGRALNAFAAVGQSMASPEEIGAAAREAVALLEPLGPSGDLAEAWCTLGALHANHSQLDGVVEAMQRALAIWEDIADARGQVTVLHNLAGLYAELGDLDLALDALARAEAIRRDAGLPVIADETLNAVDTLLQAGRVDEATRRLLAIVAARPHWGRDAMLDAGFTVLTARVLVRRGRPEAGIRLHAAARAGMLRLGLHPDFVERLAVDPLLSASPPPTTTEEGAGLPDPQGWALLRAEGAALSLAAAVEQALEALAAPPTLTDPSGD